MINKYKTIGEKVIGKYHDIYMSFMFNKDTVISEVGQLLFFLFWFQTESFCT